MIAKLLEEIEYADLQALIGVAREHKRLEFKLLLEEGDKGARKLVKGVSSLANTAGGDFIIGMAEDDNGVAVDVPGIAENADVYKGRIEQVLRSQIEPRLPATSVHPVACPDGRWAFIVRVPQSWVGPHRTNYNKEFYIRTSHGADPMDVPELRSAFGLRDGVVEKIERFRDQRLGQILSGQGLMPLTSPTVAVLHMVSLPAFANRELIDVFGRLSVGSQMILPMSGAHTSTGVRLNLHGYMNFSGDTLKTIDSYSQIFRTGAIEGVDCLKRDKDGPFIENIGFANMIVGAVKNFLTVQGALDIGFPTYSMLSLCNARGLRMRVQQAASGLDHWAIPLDDQLIAFPETVFESPGVDVPATLRPLLDVVWNAFGLAACDMFTPQGTWKGTA